LWPPQRAVFQVGSLHCRLLVSCTCSHARSRGRVLAKRVPCSGPSLLLVLRPVPVVELGLNMPLSQPLELRSLGPTTPDPLWSIRRLPWCHGGQSAGHNRLLVPCLCR
jgi:hypothetical protein